MLIATAVGFGVLIGLALGALGGGGSILTLPVLVFALGLTAQEATTGSLVIVGITAAAASVAHARAGETRWREGLVLAAFGVPTSVLGTRLNRTVDPDLLLLAFAALMLVAAAGMFLRARPEHPAGAAPAAEPSAPVGSTRHGTDATTLTRTHDRTAGRRLGLLRLAPAGLVIGFLTGFLGVGGGFVVVPALVVLLGVAMPVAVGTSLVVIALNCGVALAARASHDSFVWGVVVPFTAAAVAASYAGKRVSDRTDPATLTRAFAVLLVVVAGYVAVRAVLSMT